MLGDFLVPAGRHPEPESSCVSARLTLVRSDAPPLRERIGARPCGQEPSASRRPPARSLRLVLAAEHPFARTRVDYGPVVILGPGQVVDLVALARDVALDGAGGLYRRRWGCRGLLRLRPGLDAVSALGAPPVRRRIKGAGPEAALQRTRGRLGPDIVAGVALVGRGVALAHHPGVQVLLAFPAHGNGAAISVRV